jgi:hypothetical protein
MHCGKRMGVAMACQLPVHGCNNVNCMPPDIFPRHFSNSDFNPILTHPTTACALPSSTYVLIDHLQDGVSQKPMVMHRAHSVNGRNLRQYLASAKNSLVQRPSCRSYTCDYASRWNVLRRVVEGGAYNQPRMSPWGACRASISGRMLRSFRHSLINFSGDSDVAL